MATTEGVFGSRELSLMISTFASVNARNGLFRSLFQKGSKIVSEDPRHVEWDKRTYAETLAPFVGMTDAPPTTAMPKDSNQITRMAKIAHVISIPGDRLFYMREVGELKPNAQSVVNAALKQGLDMIDRSLELLAALALLDNFVINSTVVPGSKTAFGAASSFGNGTISNTDWSNTASLIASSLIPAQVDQFRQASGLTPAQIFINTATELFLLKNVEIQGLLSGFQGAYAVLQNQHAATDVMNGLGIGNLKWQKHVGGYKPDSTTWTEYLPVDKSIMLPEDAALPGVLGWAEGYNLIPAQLWGNGGNAATQMMRAPSPGVSVYSELKTQPMRVELVFEWLGTPLILHPPAVQVGSL